MPEQEEGQRQSEIAQLMQIVQQQGQQIATLVEQQGQSTDRFNQYTQSIQEAGEQDSNDSYVPDASEEELESMTNAQLVQHLEGRLGSALENAVGAAMEPVSNDLAATQEYMQSNNVNSEINGMMQQHPDFQMLANDIADVIESRAKNGYSISMDDAYQLARSANPDKVAQVEQTQASARPNLAGGLLPTSRMIGEKGDDQDMDFDTAMDKAFKEEVMDQGLSTLFDDSGITVTEVPEES